MLIDRGVSFGIMRLLMMMVMISIGINVSIIRLILRLFVRLLFSCSLLSLVFCRRPAPARVHPERMPRAGLQASRFCNLAQGVWLRVCLNFGV